MGQQYLVKQGDCLSSIAKRFKLPGYKTIYDHPQNAELRRKRPNPNVIFPGDRVFVPDKSRKEEQGATEQRHIFALKGEPVKLRIRLQDDAGNAHAGKRYTLRVDETVHEGTTGGDGLIEHQIPADAATATLKIELDGAEGQKTRSWLFSLGGLDPADEITGVQARLNNLGFFCGAVDGVCGEMTEAGLKAFQAKTGLAQTGRPDAATKDALRRKHDEA